MELKLTFSLALVMQGVARQSLFDAVYLAVPVSSARGWKLRYADIVRLCRRLGLGLLAVNPARSVVEAHLDPAPYTPRRNMGRATRLLRIDVLNEREYAETPIGSIEPSSWEGAVRTHTLAHADSATHARTPGWQTIDLSLRRPVGR